MRDSLSIHVQAHQWFLPITKCFWKISSGAVDLEFFWSLGLIFIPLLNNPDRVRLALVIVAL